MRNDAIAGVVMSMTAILLSGCAARRPSALHWQLRGGADGLILTPPRAQPGAALDLKKARSVNPRRVPCDVTEPEIGLAWRGSAAHVVLQTAVVSAPQVTLVGPTQPTAEPVRDLAWWPRFQDELAKRQRDGCLARGEVERLSARIVENLSLPPSLSYKLHYGDYVMRGYIDVGPRFALKSVTPLPGPDRTSFETAWYDVQAGRGGSLKLILRRVEQTTRGTVTPRSRPVVKPLVLASSARYARLFFRAWRVSGDYRIALLASSEAGWLDAMTSRFETDPERFCRDTDPKQASCLAVPVDTMVTAEMKVRANGQPAYAPVGGSVADVLRAQGVRNPAGVLDRLSVLRSYEGALAPVDFDRARNDILGLTLLGGEEIRWQ